MIKEKSRSDISFEILLRSQRELLTKLNFEKRVLDVQRKENEEMLQQEQIRQFIRQQEQQQHYLNGWDNQNLTNEALDPLPLHGAESTIFLKHLSLGIGNDQYMLPAQNININDDDECISEINRQDKFGICIQPRKRRRTTLSFLDYLFDKGGENVDVEENGSTNKAQSHNDPPESQMSNCNQSEYEDSSDDDDYGVFVEDVVEGEGKEQESIMESPVSLVETRQVKECMVSFESCMGKSFESQQRIHDWDRKMGLKRSHSKTMRLSMRSRKKLRQFMKKDIMHITKMV